MQIDPIKPKLKPPGIKRLKLKYDELLSRFAFKFNLRRYIKDDELTWLLAGSLIIDMEGGGASLPFPTDELRLIDTKLDFTATFNKDAGVSGITLAVDGSFRFASGTDPASPFVKMSGDFKFNYPCVTGDSVVLNNIKGAVNVGSFAVSLGNSAATFFCLPIVGDILFDIDVAVDLVKLDTLVITDVKVTGVGIVKEGGGTDFMAGADNRSHFSST